MKKENSFKNIDLKVSNIIGLEQKTKLGNTIENWSLFSE